MSGIDWFRFAALLGGELLLVALIAVVLHMCFRSPQAQRSIWQAVFTSMGLLTIIEVSGIREKLPWPVWTPRHHYFMTATVQPAQTQGAPEPHGVEASSANSREAAPGIVTWPGRIWLTGFILLLTRLFVSWVLLRIRRRSALQADAESLRLVEQLQTSLRLSGLRAQNWKGLRGPVAFGIFRPTIALPRDFSERYSIGERHVMLAHEMAHLAARDPFWFLISDAVIALAWWHPVVWWARRKLNVASEVCADEASALVPGGPTALAECLVRFGRELTDSRWTQSLGVGGNGLKSQLAIRIANLLREPETWRPPSAWISRMTHLSATAVAATAIFLPIQTGISGSILALMIVPTPANAATPLVPREQVKYDEPGPNSSQTDHMAVADVAANDFSDSPISGMCPMEATASARLKPCLCKQIMRPPSIAIPDNPLSESLEYGRPPDSGEDVRRIGHQRSQSNQRRSNGSTTSSAKRSLPPGSPEN